MASVTLAESAKLSQNMLASGVIQDVVTVNQMFNALPFQEIEGNALQYSRESVLGDAMVAGVGTQITADAAATFTTVTSSLTTIIGKASVNGLIQATRSNYSDQALVQIASKAKSVGRKYQDMLINGDSGTANEFDGLLSLVSGGQTVTSATDGSVLSFRALDDAIALCTAKDGMIDYIAMNSREINTLLDMYRALGGASINEVVTLPDGTVTNMPMYRGIPIYRNDWLPITQVQGASSVASSIVMGTFDDGSMSNGIAGLTAMGDAGMRVVQVGQAENYDEEVYHIKWYSSLANYSDKGLVAITGIVPA
jgi:hypothetical protein